MLVNDILHQCVWRWFMQAFFLLVSFETYLHGTTPADNESLCKHLCFRIPVARYTILSGGSLKELGSLSWLSLSNAVAMCWFFKCICLLMPAKDYIWYVQSGWACTCFIFWLNSNDLNFFFCKWFFAVRLKFSTTFRIREMSRKLQYLYAFIEPTGDPIQLAIGNIMTGWERQNLTKITHKLNYYRTIT